MACHRKHLATPDHTTNDQTERSTLTTHWIQKESLQKDKRQAYIAPKQMLQNDLKCMKNESRKRQQSSN